LTGVFKPPTYETFHALKDINFTVEEGEALGIIGENGSGKSTLLKIIANILRPSSGSVTTLKKLTPFLELGIGFQPDLTAAENIKIYATIMGMPIREINDKLDDIIEFAGLEKFRDTKLKNFSSGMHVRLAFSTAVQTDPEILLLDEVLAVGDMEFQQKCLDVLSQYRKNGVTIIFVSHDLGSVRRFCDTALFLHKGKQIALGNTAEVIDSYVYSGNQEEALNQINDLEAEPSENKTPRGKDKKIEVTNVEFYDKFNNKGARFNSFDQMTMKIFYNAYERISDPVFGIAIYSENGENLFGTNTELKNVSIDSLEGEGHIDLMIERIPMLTGRFLLTVAVHTHDQKLYDWHDKQYSFNVISTCRDVGLFEVPCNWKI
jgi:lipopolysaccharide transport system ATP-binding protein